MVKDACEHGAFAVRMLHLLELVNFGLGEDLYSVKALIVLALSWRGSEQSDG
jgi:hypothetical protein